MAWYYDLMGQENLVSEFHAKSNFYVNINKVETDMIAKNCIRGPEYKQVGYAITILVCHKNCHLMVFHIHTKYTEILATKKRKK